jgi:hypothetical protein
MARHNGGKIQVLGLELDFDACIDGSMWQLEVERMDRLLGSA